jgi:hypothetical protein
MTINGVEQWRKAKTGLKNGIEILPRGPEVQRSSEPKSPIAFHGQSRSDTGRGKLKFTALLLHSFVSR